MCFLRNLALCTRLIQKSPLLYDHGRASHACGLLVLDVRPWCAWGSKKSSMLLTVRQDEPLYPVMSLSVEPLSAAWYKQTQQITATLDGRGCAESLQATVSPTGSCLAIGVLPGMVTAPFG